MFYSIWTWVILAAAVYHVITVVWLMQAKEFGLRKRLGQAVTVVFGPWLLLVFILCVVGSIFVLAIVACFLPDDRVDMHG